MIVYSGRLAFVNKKDYYHWYKQEKRTKNVKLLYLKRKSNLRKTFSYCRNLLLRQKLLKNFELNTK